jgi:heptose I phosphotransferase
MSRDGPWQRLIRGVRRVRERPDWMRFAGTDWAERIMTVAVTDQFHAKQGRSTGRWVLQNEAGQLVVYLKRHYRLPWWRGLLAALWPGHGWSPASTEWRNLAWARTEGLPVPAAVAAAEDIGPWGRLQSCLAVEELAGMLPLHEAILLAATRLTPPVFRQWKRTLAQELARLVRALHARGRFHKDLYLCHFFIPTEDTQSLPAWPGRVHLIDLHRLAHHAWTGWLWQVKDLGQLLYSSFMTGVEDRDRLWFWRAYLGTEAWGASGGWLRWAVCYKGRRYLRHNARKRAKAQAANRKGRAA